MGTVVQINVDGPIEDLGGGVFQLTGANVYAVRSRTSEYIHRVAEWAGTWDCSCPQGSSCGYIVRARRAVEDR